MIGPPRVVYWNNQPTPYVVDRFNAVADRGLVDLEVWFDNLRQADRSWDVEPDAWRFRSLVLGTTDDDHPLDRVPLDLLECIRPDVLIANYDRPHMVLGLTAAQGIVRRTAVRCLPTWPAWDTPRTSRTLAKHLLFRSVDGAKVPGPDGAAYAASFGLPERRTAAVTQSVDVGHYALARAVPAGDRRRLRDRLGATGCAFVYVGRIWQGKGVFTLVDAFERVRRALPDATLLLVGDGSDEEQLRLRTSGIDGVRWVGFVQPRDMPEVYAAADVLVFPTLGDPNGLVVEEALAAALPVVSTSAAGDIGRRIPDGTAGRIVAPADAIALANAMIELGADPDLRRRYGAAAARLSVRAAPDRYADDFERFVTGLVDHPTRRTPAALAARAAAPGLRAVIRGRPGRAGFGSPARTLRN